MDRHSASIEDFEIDYYFLNFQEIGTFPKNLHQPVIDFIVYGHQTQSVSFYVWSCIATPVGKKRPRMKLTRRVVLPHL